MRSNVVFDSSSGRLAMLAAVGRLRRLWWSTMRHYMQLLRAAVTASLMLVAITGVAVAGPLEDAEAAYARGDYETALRLWRQLADQGNAQAQNKLGEMYLNGLFQAFKGELVHQNCTEALMCLTSPPITDLLRHSTPLVIFTREATACLQTSAKHENGIARLRTRAMARLQ